MLLYFGLLVVFLIVVACLFIPHGVQLVRVDGGKMVGMNTSGVTRDDHALRDVPQEASCARTLKGVTYWRHGDYMAKCRIVDGRVKDYLVTGVEWDAAPLSSPYRYISRRGILDVSESGIVTQTTRLDGSREDVEFIAPPVEYGRRRWIGVARIKNDDVTYDTHVFYTVVNDARISFSDPFVFGGHTRARRLKQQAIGMTVEDNVATIKWTHCNAHVFETQIGMADVGRMLRGLSIDSAKKTTLSDELKVGSIIQSAKHLFRRR
ncbi:MAG: hypothetical protein CMK92_01935 [Pseudomonas sp.]|nr:hypothetical protein [Pseudomonas sp.]